MVSVTQDAESDISCLLPPSCRNASYIHPNFNILAPSLSAQPPPAPAVVPHRKSQPSPSVLSCLSSSFVARTARQLLWHPWHPANSQNNRPPQTRPRSPSSRAESANVLARCVFNLRLLFLFTPVNTPLGVRCLPQKQATLRRHRYVLRAIDCSLDPLTPSGTKRHAVTGKSIIFQASPS